MFRVKIKVNYLLIFGLLTYYENHCLYNLPAENLPDVVVIMNPGIHSDYYESWKKSLKPVMRAKIPMFVTCWNSSEELAPTVLHLNTIFDEVFKVERLGRTRHIPKLKCQIAPQPAQNLLFTRQRLEQERIDQQHDQGRRIVEIIEEEDENAVLEEIQELDLSDKKVEKVNLLLETGLNPFCSEMYIQHDKRPNQVRKSNWCFIMIDYETVYV